MALVKTSKIAAVEKPASASKPPKPARAPKPAPVLQGGVGKDKLAERTAAATEELAAGLAEASSAAEELRRAMEQIAAGAEEAAGGAQEQVAAIRATVATLVSARTQADGSRRRTEALQVVLAETSVQITTSVRCAGSHAPKW